MFYFFLFLKHNVASNRHQELVGKIVHSVVDKTAFISLHEKPIQIPDFKLDILADPKSNELKYNGAYIIYKLKNYKLLIFTYF